MQHLASLDALEGLDQLSDTPLDPIQPYEDPRLTPRAEGGHDHASLEVFALDGPLRLYLVRQHLGQILNRLLKGDMIEEPEDLLARGHFLAV